MIKKLLKKKTIPQLIKYIYISIFGYAFVFISLYILVDIFLMNEKLAFLLIYGICYLMLYALQLKLLFKAKHENKKFIRFCFYLFFFYIIANLFYNLGLYFNLNYLYSTAVTILLLVPFRFIVVKLFVFKA